MNYSFSGPAVHELIWRPIVGFCVGCLVGSLTKTSGGWIGLAFAAHEVADVLFYQMAHHAASGDEGRKSAQIYAFTNLIANAATAGLLYRFNLIGLTGIMASSSIMALELVCKSMDFSKYKVATLPHAGFA